MKTKLLTTGLFAFLAMSFATAQDVTTVNAQNSDISDNLDLKAVASIFGDSKDLTDFERRLNDPKLQISNLDLNNDNMVDYLRVIESVEDNTHVIVLQAVIGKDLFQDVATIEVERNNRNRVQVQVVGNVYMYGNNYIYEPVYVSRPVIYNTFWVHNYRPYCSNYYYNYYPSYYYAWTPYPIYTYHQNVHYHINTNNYYYYADTRRSQRAIAMHRSTRGNAYENQYPNRSFTQRNNVANRRELASVNTRNTASNSTRTASEATSRNETAANSQATTRSEGAIRTTTEPTRNNTVRSTVQPTQNNIVRSTVQPTQNNTVRSTVQPTQNNIVRSTVQPTQNNIVRNTASVPTRSSETNNYAAPIRSALTSASASSHLNSTSSSRERSPSMTTSRSNISQNPTAAYQRSASQSISRR